MSPKNKPNRVLMSDICELAHTLTVRECKEKRIKVVCKNVKDCGDKNHTHHNDPDFTHYTPKAQAIFYIYYNLITNILNV